MRYSRAGIIPTNPEVTGMDPVAVATLMIRTFSEDVKGLVVYLENSFKVINPKRSERTFGWPHQF
jgi:hypothetical protein